MSFEKDASGFVKVGFRHEALTGNDIEWVWCKPEIEGLEVRNNFFHAKGYAFCDLISAKEEGGRLYVKKSLRESGHSNIMILVESRDSVAKYQSQFEEMGCVCELGTISTLIALDVPPDVHYADIKKVLEIGEEKGVWGYQEGCLSAIHRVQIDG